MNEPLNDKSHKIINRIEMIKAEIESHKASIKLLHEHAREFYFLNKNCFAPRVIKYTSIPRSRDRYLLTLRNISEQIILLENELAVLIEYGV